MNYSVVTGYASDEVKSVGCETFAEAVLEFIEQANKYVTNPERPYYHTRVWGDGYDWTPDEGVNDGLTDDERLVLEYVDGWL